MVRIVNVQQQEMVPPCFGEATYNMYHGRKAQRLHDGYRFTTWYIKGKGDETALEATFRRVPGYERVWTPKMLYVYEGYRGQHYPLDLYVWLCNEYAWIIRGGDKTNCQSPGAVKLWHDLAHNPMVNVFARKNSRSMFHPCIAQDGQAHTDKVEIYGNRQSEIWVTSESLSEFKESVL